MTQPVKRDDDSHGDDPYAMWDAAYVLGSLSGAERREFEAHLATRTPESFRAAPPLGSVARSLVMSAHELARIDVGG